MLHPGLAMGLGSQVSGLVNRDWNGMDQTAELDKKRAALPVMAVSENKDNYNAYDEAPKGSVAIIPLKGTMLKYGTLCEYGMVEVAHEIRTAALSENIGGIVLDVDSGGGSVDAIAPVVSAIEFSKALGKPVVASVDMACSAAYWAASVCDKIIADNSISAEVGSIGVMMSFWDVKGFYEEKGYKLHTIYAPESDQKNLPFEMALKGEYDLIKTEELSPLAISFQEAIKGNRVNKINLEIPGILNGKTFLSGPAMEHGLIDAIGSLTLAVDTALELAAITNFLRNR